VIPGREQLTTPGQGRKLLEDRLAAARCRPYTDIRTKSRGKGERPHRRDLMAEKSVRGNLVPPGTRVPHSSQDKGCPCHPQAQPAGPRVCRTGSASQVQGEPLNDGRDQARTGSPVFPPKDLARTNLSLDTQFPAEAPRNQRTGVFWVTLTWPRSDLSAGR
jgi:hypothetical protein